MLFMLTISLSLQILALVAGAFLFSWGLHKEGSGTGVARFFGFITTVIALFSLICTLYFATKFWHDGGMYNRMHPMPQAQEMQDNASPAPPVHTKKK